MRRALAAIRVEKMVGAMRSMATDYIVCRGDRSHLVPNSGYNTADVCVQSVCLDRLQQWVWYKFVSFFFSYEICTERIMGLQLAMLALEIAAGAPSHLHPGNSSINSILCWGIGLPCLYGPTRR